MAGIIRLVPENPVIFSFFINIPRKLSDSVAFAVFPSRRICQKSKNNKVSEFSIFTSPPPAEAVPELVEGWSAAPEVDEPIECSPGLQTRKKANLKVRTTSFLSFPRRKFSAIV